MKKLNILIFVFVLSVSTRAHEVWLEPENFFLKANEKTAVHLYVGDGLIKDREERGFIKEKTPVFSLFSAGNPLDLTKSVLSGAMPVYNFSSDKSGNYLFALHRDWSFIKLSPKDFEEYLREDGMEYIINERAKLNESAKDGSERYSRYLKTLLQVGDKNDDSFKKITGLKLEIIPLTNPYAVKSGSKLKFKILFEGKPLSNKTVFADNRTGEKVSTQKFTTDKKGEFSFKSNAGFWLVRMVFMQRCKMNCGETDWESFWGAFSFGVK